MKVVVVTFQLLWKTRLALLVFIFFSSKVQIEKTTTTTSCDSWIFGDRLASSSRQNQNLDSVLHRPGRHRRGDNPSHSETRAE